MGRKESASLCRVSGLGCSECPGGRSKTVEWNLRDISSQGDKKSLKILKWINYLNDKGKW